MHSNGLVYAGEHGVEATWMNSYIKGKPVTPRMGFAVEVNALWYNALCFALQLAEENSDNAFVKKWDEIRKRIESTFIHTFWSDEHGYLADCVNGNDKDFAIRPNQIIAASLPYTVLNDGQIKSILNIVSRDLLTTRGLRTFEPSHSNFEGEYKGSQEDRDRAIHQGTVHPWLIEHYCNATYKLYKKSGISAVKKIIADFESVVNEHGIGTVSEIYDGNPPFYARGAISMAKSVAAMLMIIDKYELM